MTAPDGDQITVGSVAVEVVADAKRFARSLRRELQGAFQGIGKDLQRAVNKEMGGRGRNAGVQIRVRIDEEQAAREARRALTSVRRVFRDAGPVRMRVNINDAQAEKEGRRASRLATKAAGPIRLKVQVSDREAAGAGRKVKEEVQRRTRPIQIPVDVDRNSLARVLSTIAGLGRTALIASAGLAAIGAIGSGVSAALAGIAALGAGAIQILGQLGAVAISAAGALAAIPGALAIAGAGIGALVIGSSGLGAALKEAGKAAGGAGGAAVDMGRQMQRAARQVELAQRAVGDAARGVVLAERRLADAQRASRAAQEDLNRARKDAKERLEDLTLALAGARLDEEAAVIALRDAERELAGLLVAPLADPEAIERADLRYRQAQQTLAEVRERLEDLTEEQQEAAAAGVEGSDEVQAALERQRQAAFELEDAQYDLRRAQLRLEDAYYNLAEAQRDLADAQKAGAAGAGGAASAFSKLAPAAQELVRALLALKPAWDALRLDVQQALWEGVAAEITNLAESQLPVLREGLVEVASVINGIMRRGLRQLAAESSRIRLAEILDSAAASFQGLGRAVQPAIRALLDVSAVGARVLAELAGPAGNAITRFADRVSEMAATGELRQLILDGLGALRQLGAALVDIGGIIKGFFGAAAAAGGGGLFQFLDRLNELVNSTRGQNALTNLFTELGRIGDALMPVLLALGEGLAVVSRAIGDIAVGTAPQLADFLGLLADALASLAPGFIALGPSVVALGRALLPLGEILANLVVGIAPGVEAFLLALADGLDFLVPVASLVGEALGDLLVAVAPLLPILGAALANALTELAIIVDAVANGPLAILIDVVSELATTFATRMLPILIRLAEQLFPIFAEASTRILEAFEPLLPVFVDLAEVIANKLADAMPQLVDAFAQLAFALADMSVELVEALVEAFIQLAPQLPQLVDAGVALAIALADLVVAMIPLIPMLTRLLTWVMRLVTPQTLGALTVLIGLAAGSMRTLAAILPAVVAPLGSIATLLSGVDWGGIGSAIGGAFSAAWETVADFFSDVFLWFNNLPATIAVAVGNTVGTLRTKGRDLITGLLNGITSRWTAVR
ncbi:MAG TPA: hypothetical protein VIL46_14430, partial [Gemmataceae bacterium]